MACPSADTLQEYVDAALAPIESTLVRDHLLTCTACARRAKSYRRLNLQLAHPPLCEPPDSILQGVMKRLYPEIPSLSSVAALIAASLLFLVTWIYIYFDFAHNSLVQAYQMAQGSTAGWIGSIMRVISTVFSAIYASFKAINAFWEVIFRVHLGVPAVSAIVMTCSMLFLLLLFRLFARYLKAGSK